MPARKEKKNVLPVVQLVMERSGEIREKVADLHRDVTIENTLLEALYPGIRVATVDVPREPLSDYEQSQVAQSLMRIEHQGVRYALVGASSSGKEGKYYSVDAQFERAIRDRFLGRAEAAIVYFGILVGPCKARIEVPDCRVMVVDDLELGTNDCRGWIRRSLFNQLGLPDRRFYQFRLAFEKTQAKGSFKIMEDNVAGALESDVILPVSSVKPEFQGPSRLMRWLVGSAKTFRGPAVLGIREISRAIEFSSSYTLIEHAPADSIEEEIKPRALEQVSRLKAAVEGQEMEELLRLLGTSETQQVLDWNEGHPDPGYTSVENTLLEAILKADGSGSMVLFPWVRAQLQRRLATWAFKACTAGGLSLPAFALADDGFLILHGGEVFCGADWMPKEGAFTRLPCRDLLVVRYPIRTKEDLLPVFNIGVAEMSQMLIKRLRDSGCPMTQARMLDSIIIPQLCLDGTLVLHSETAKRNGGDYDFDTVCVVEGDKFPRFVQDRFAYKERIDNRKQKLAKKRSPWFTLPYVALQAKGSQIGSITDLKTSCLAAGRPELAEKLAVQLQAALDQLKFGIEPDRKVIKAIRDEVPKAPWLASKSAERVEELPVELKVEPTDVIGRLYNSIRPQIEELFAPEQARHLSDYRGLVMYGPYPERMYEEARKLCRMYAARIGEITAKRQKLEQAVQEAQAEFGAKKDDPRTRAKAMFRLNQAKAALHHFEKDRKEMKALISQVQKWGQTRKGDRRLWLAALFDAAASGRGNGSVVFYAFPQEMVDAIVDRTGGRRVEVAVPDLCDGDVEIDADGRVYLLAEQDKRLLFQVHVTPEGDVLRDSNRNGQAVSSGKVHPFPIVPGRGEVRDGKVVFPGTVQRPQIRTN